MLSTVVSLEDSVMSFTPFEFTEFAVMHKGIPINLKRRPWLRQIYNSPVSRLPDGRMRRKMLLIFGRQCEKSTTIGNFLISMSNLQAYLRSLYVTASNPQMREFSDERLRTVIANSPVLLELTGKNIVGGRETQNVQTKRWLNQSKIILRSVYRSPDRVRGISADLLTIDELQDIYTDSLPVIEETLFHCELDEGPLSIYAGTPKTFDNPLEHYWSRYSTKNEWMTRCRHCNTWNMVEEQNIGPVGLICKTCKGDINPVTDRATWVRFGGEDREWNGFRLPQPIVPYAYYNNKELFSRHWKSLLDKRKRYPRQKFFNEVMASSYDAGTKPVSLEEVRACCDPELSMVDPENVPRHTKDNYCWAGVDWGTGDGSYTVLSIWTYDVKGRFCLLFAKKYVGTESDPDHSWRDIVTICKKFGVTRIGADWGFGFYTNSQLKKMYGNDRVCLYQHAGKQNDKVKWGGQKFTTHRTRVLQDVFTIIKRGRKNGGVTLPKWGVSEDFANDILSVYSEYSEARREIVFNHPRGNPDDFLHTMCYALLVSQFEKRRPDLHRV